MPDDIETLQLDDVSVKNVTLSVEVPTRLQSQGLSTPGAIHHNAFEQKSANTITPRGLVLHNYSVCPEWDAVGKIYAA